MKKQTDVVVGSGPGGASVARQLARAGKRVLEREPDYRKEFCKRSAVIARSG